MDCSFLMDSYARDRLRCVENLVSALAEIDTRYLESNPHTLPLYSLASFGRILYREDARGVQVFKDIPACIRTRHADCKSMVAWRIAELAVKGIKAEPRAVVVKAHRDGLSLHVTLKSAMGAEDPSAIVKQLSGLS